MGQVFRLGQVEFPTSHVDHFWGAKAAENPNILNSPCRDSYPTFPNSDGFENEINPKNTAKKKQINEQINEVNK